MDHRVATRALLRRIQKKTLTDRKPIISVEMLEREKEKESALAIAVNS